MSSKQNKFIDLSLLSGSSDSFRTLLGGYYLQESTTEGEGLFFVDFNSTTPIDKRIEKVFSGVRGQAKSDYSDLVPKFSFPMRIVGRTEDFESDQEWRAFILGGSYGKKSYSTKFTNTTHEYLMLDYDTPYNKKEILYLQNEGISDTIEISYDYTQHVREFEESIQDFNTELFIPNYYIMSDIYRFKDVDLNEIKKVYPSELVSFLTFDGVYETPEMLFSFNSEKIPYDVPSHEIDSFTEIRKRNTDLINDYLVSPGFSAPSDAGTSNWAASKQKTIILDSESIANQSVAQDYQDCLPYKIKISFPTKETGNFVQDFVEDKFDSKFMSALSDVFVHGTVPSLTERDYTVASEFKVGERNTNPQSVESVSTISNREINYIDFLIYCRDVYQNQNSDTMYIGENNLQRLSAMDDKGKYRHISTKNSLSSLRKAYAFLNDSTQSKINTLKDLFSKNNKYNETIAYRIEKIGGPPTGDRFTQEALQNYWFLNSDTLDVLDFFDSQVKTNQDYTYNIFAYILVSGFEYQYENLLLTRDLGCSGELEKIESAYSYGLEFYNAESTTGPRAERLFRAFPGITGKDFDDSAGGEYGTNAQIYSNYKYLADFNLNYQPFLKIIEVPLYSKTLRILDNPPNRLNVVPYQILDDSQRVGFDLYYDAFSNSRFPSPVTETDEIYRERYLNGKDIDSTTKITEETVSKQRTIEVYRTNFKPSSLRDFEGNLHKTIDLRPNNQKFYRDTFATCISQIRTNQKYYYLFRVLNELGTPGHISEIYETELINDGGYMFALFNTIHESELKETLPPKLSTQFKKIFHVRPKFEHIAMDTSEVDFAQPAESQKSKVKIGPSGDSIWDKTFKIRLTSKKTGKKADLNITYKISNE